MEEQEAKSNLTMKQEIFVREYVKSFNATKAALKAGYSKDSAYSIGSENLKKPEIKKAIRELIEPLVMEESEILIGVTSQARADIGSFFKIVTEWVRFPLPTYEIIDEEEREIALPSGLTIKAPFYKVKHVCLDTNKLKNPRYSKLVKKFSDSPKNGLSIEIYDKQGAYQLIAKLNGLLTDKVDVTTDGEKIVSDDTKDYARSLSKLADAIGESLSRQGAEPQSSVDTAKHAPMESDSDTGR